MFVLMNRSIRRIIASCRPAIVIVHVEVIPVALLLGARVIDTISLLKQHPQMEANFACCRLFYDPTAGLATMHVETFILLDRWMRHRSIRAACKGGRGLPVLLGDSQVPAVPPTERLIAVELDTYWDRTLVRDLDTIAQGSDVWLESPRHAMTRTVSHRKQGTLANHLVGATATWAKVPVAGGQMKAEAFWVALRRPRVARTKCYLVRKCRVEARRLLELLVQLLLLFDASVQSRLHLANCLLSNFLQNRLAVTLWGILGIIGPVLDHSRQIGLELLQIFLAHLVANALGKLSRRPNPLRGNLFV
mmetsp:Transcript_4500/g.11621  ORF Transcript_4500/g.11621 Transcript_4500/m.11621 type:complete len:305 (-) Transcript_4500:182-1096(-)